MADTENPKPAEQEGAQPTPEGPQDEEQFEIPLPPATFEWLVYSLQLDARMALGLVYFGEEKDKPKPDLKRAQHFIDLLAIVQEKTRGNLSLEEQRYLENCITELRFRFVQTADEQRKQ